MKEIEVIINELTHIGINPNELSEIVGVSKDTIKRWIKGKSKPKVVYESLIRKEYERIIGINLENKNNIALNIQDKIDGLLNELREILHKRSRFSSRNEALEEISKLLFAHIVSLMNENCGIEIVKGTTENDKDLPVNLRKFVKEKFDKYLPTSIQLEMNNKDFMLNIKDQEIDLTKEIIKCFNKNINSNDSDMLKEIQGTDVLNVVFGKFLADSFSDEKQLGQYLTPPEIVNFIIEIIWNDLTTEEKNILINTPEKFGLILDPSCGVGSFLAVLIDIFSKNISQEIDENFSKRWIKNIIQYNIMGIDKSERMIKLALTNLAMFGFTNVNMHLYNSLENVLNYESIVNNIKGKVKIIITNPPFGAEYSGTDLENYKIVNDWARNTPQKVNSEILFFEKYLDWLMPGGILICIVPDSILTNKGLYEDLRVNIVEYFEIKGVISLPQNTFSAAGTDTKTSILYLRKKSKNELNKQEKTFCGICSDIGYTIATKGSHKVKIKNDNSDLKKLLMNYVSKSEHSGMCRWRIEIKNQVRWDAIFHAYLPISIENKLKENNDEYIYIRDVAELSYEKCNPKRWGEGEFNYIEISDVDLTSLKATSKLIKCQDAPSRAKKIVKLGDVLFSTVRPERGVIAVVGSNQDKFVCTSGFAVITPNKIDPTILAYLLKSKFALSQIIRLSMGVSYPVIDEAHLMDILLPIKFSDLDVLKENAYKIRSLEERLDYELDKFKSRIDNLINE